MLLDSFDWILSLAIEADPIGVLQLGGEDWKFEMESQGLLQM
jgi:hypothetical protein